jgi:mannose-6-phosphate isomerase
MVELILLPTDTKQTVFTTVANYLRQLHLGTTSVDADRPWGGFFVINELQTADFIQKYFPNLPEEQIAKGGKLSPKILVVEAGKRLSWQYHDRREELWRVVSGPVGIVTSPDDNEGPVQTLESDQVLQFGTHIRHRLLGLENWGIVAEIWQHTDASNPSNEADIVRVTDDFGR